MKVARTRSFCIELGLTSDLPLMADCDGSITESEVAAPTNGVAGSPEDVGRALTGVGLISLWPCNNRDQKLANSEGKAM